MSVDAQNYINVLGLNYEILLFCEVHMLCFFVVLYKPHEDVTTLRHNITCTVNVFELGWCNVNGESDTIVTKIIYTTRLYPDAIVHESRLLCTLFRLNIRSVFLCVLLES
jgi:hypothetical protein